MDLHKRIASDYKQTIDLLRRRLAFYYGNPWMIYVGKKQVADGSYKDMYVCTVITATMAPYVYLIVLAEPTPPSLGYHLRGAALSDLEWVIFYFKTYFDQSQIPEEILSTPDIENFPLDLRNINLATRIQGYDYYKVDAACVPGEKVIYVNDETHSSLTIKTGKKRTAVNNCDTLPHTLNLATALSNFLDASVEILPP